VTREDRNFELFIKTYPDDYHYLSRLLDSIDSHNIERIPVVLCDHSTNFERLKALVGTRAYEIILFPEERLFKNLRGLEHEEPKYGGGYYRQMYAKLMYGLENRGVDYLCVDSDGIFIKDFGHDAFFDRRGVPHFFFEDDRELYSQDDYWNAVGCGREEAFQRICDFFQIDQSLVLRPHGFQTIRGREVAAFQTWLRDEKDMEVHEALCNFGYEFALHAAFLARVGTDRTPRLSPFRYFHSAEQMYLASLQMKGEESLRRSFIGVVYNSNFSRAWGKINLSQTKYLIPSRRFHLRVLKVASWMTISRFSPRRILRTAMYWWNRSALASRMSRSTRGFLRRHSGSTQAPK